MDSNYVTNALLACLVLLSAMPHFATLAAIVRSKARRRLRKK